MANKLNKYKSLQSIFSPFTLYPGIFACVVSYLLIFDDLLIYFQSHSYQLDAIKLSVQYRHHHQVNCSSCLTKFCVISLYQMIRAATCDFRQCGILTGVDSYEPVQPPFKLRNSKWCSVSSITLIKYSSD